MSYIGVVLDAPVGVTADELWTALAGYMSFVRVQAGETFVDQFPINFSQRAGAILHMAEQELHK